MRFMLVDGLEIDVLSRLTFLIHKSTTFVSGSRVTLPFCKFNSSQSNVVRLSIGKIGLYLPRSARGFEFSPSE